MFLRTTRRIAVTTAALSLAVTALGAAPAAADHVAAGAHVPRTNAPIKVRLTVQGPDGVLFQGRVTTKGHDVTTASGGTHKCDGTNGGAHASKVPTPTAALDDAARKNGFTWDGTWYPAFDDFFVESIKNVSGGATAYWNIAVNGTPTPVGGCQFKLTAGDQVSFTWTSF